MSSPFFSIVIPTYNRAELLKRTVESFLKQTFTDFELIIVDDGGTDETKAVINGMNDNRFRYFWKENGERAAARKFGAEKASGAYINYFDSDDIAYSNHLKTAHDAVTALGNPAVFHLGLEMKDENDNILSQRIIINGSGNHRLLRTHYINPDPLFVRRDTLAQVSYTTDRNISNGEDWLYHLQLAARYDFIAFDKEITCCVVQHNTRSMSSYSGDKLLLSGRLMEKYLREDSIFMEKYGRYLPVIKADFIGLSALHYVLERKKWKAFRSLIWSYRLSPRQIFKRRTLAVIKYILK